MTARENLLACLNHKTPEWVPSGSEAVVTISSPVTERVYREDGRDAFGVHWMHDPAAEGGTYPSSGSHLVEDASLWRRHVVFPDLDKLDWSVLEKAAQKIDRSQFFVQGFVEMGIFERSYLLLGMENALVSYLTLAEAMTDLSAAIADYKIEVINRLDDAVDMDMLWYGDDWGTQMDLFLPPEIWRESIGPHTRRIYEAAKKRGILVNQHSCGKIGRLIPDIVEMGADIWNPCQPANDLKAIKRAYGDRLVLCGGIDSQFVLGRPGVTAAEVDAEVRRRIYDLAPGGGYIVAPSHSVPYAEHVQQAMKAAVTRYGREVYRDMHAQDRGGGVGRR